MRWFRSFLCGRGWHRWSKTTLVGPRLFFVVRECERCGLREMLRPWQSVWWAYGRLLGRMEDWERAEYAEAVRRTKGAESWAT